MIALAPSLRRAEWAAPVLGVLLAAAILHATPGDLVLKVSGLTLPGVINGLDLDCRAGEILGIAGQIGSGALPVDTIPSASLGIRPAGRGGDDALGRLAAALRALPRPVIGRITEGALVLDLRCLEDEAGFIATLQHLPRSLHAVP